MNIISFPCDRGGCGWYRVRQPLKLIKELTEHDTHVMDQEKDDPVAIAKALPRAQVWYLRQGGHEAVRKIKDDYDFLKKANPLWVVDLDDNVEMISPFSTHYDEWGLNEVKYGDKWLWKDGEGNFNIKENQERVNNVLESYKRADLLIVTTERLKKEMLKYNQNVEVFPNYVNLDWWWPIDRKPNKKLRIGWSGGSSHYEDLYTIKKPLNKLLREYDLEFVNIGSFFKGIFDKDNLHRVSVRPWVEFNGHSYHVMSNCIDIGITPLKDMEFNYYKSPIKFLEYSAAGIPTVSAKIPPYSDTIQQNKTGLMYNTPGQFYKAVKSLIESPHLRRELANNARKMVELDYDARKHADDLPRIFGKHINRKSGKTKNT